MGGALTIPTGMEAHLRRLDAAAAQQSGIFTDGGCTPNPGSGAWALLVVLRGEPRFQLTGYEAQTTNNRMEYRALCEALARLPVEAEVEVHTDSRLAYDTLTKWSSGWRARGWRRKAGPIKNLDLVQEMDALYRARPNARLRWVKAHAGHVWNEYVDALARDTQRRKTGLMEGNLDAFSFFAARRAVSEEGL